MKTTFLAVLTTLGCASITSGQNNLANTWEFCASAPAWTPNVSSPQFTRYVPQETTPSAVAVDPKIAVNTEQDLGTPKSVLMSPAPEVQLSGGEAAIVVDSNVRTSVRRPADNSMVRRRGGFLGRLFNRRR